MQEKIVSLATARKKKASTAGAGTSGPAAMSPFGIPFSDVYRYSDSENATNADPVTLGHAAERAVIALFAEFGVVGLPETWGELLGAIRYCMLLSAQTNKIPTNPDDDALCDSIGLRLIEQHFPELTESVVAYRVRDFATLQRISAQRLTLKVMSAHFDQKTGWVSAPRTPA